MSVNSFFNFIKFEHSVFALPFIYAAAIMAETTLPSLALLFWITLAAMGARTAGITLNRIIDKNIDNVNPRTKNREIPLGIISLKQAWIITILSLLVLFYSASQLNLLCLLLSPILPILFLVYPYLKRVSWISHLFLGFIISIGPIGGWLAITGTFDELLEFNPIQFLIPAVGLWVLGFDIIYAISDYKFDKEYGLHSIPARFGLKNAKKISRFVHSLSLLFFILVFYLLDEILLSVIPLFVISTCFILQHRISEKDSSKQIEKRFFSYNAIIAISFGLGVFIAY